MQHSPNIIERYARNFTLSDQNADPDNWEWNAESRAVWMPAREDWQTFRQNWHGVTDDQSASPGFQFLLPLPTVDPSITSSILVRESYITMFDTVWAQAIISNGRIGVIITGQPGIGKTLFLYYLLIRLLQRKQVVLFSPDGEALYLFYHDQVYSTRVGSIDESLPLPLFNSNVFIWSLFDIRKPNEPERFLVTYPCLPVQTASPDPIRYKIWNKERMPLRTGLPLWTRDELARGLQHQLRYHSLFAALHEACSSTNPSDSDPLDVYFGVRALLEEHYNEEDSVQPSPEDAINYLLDVAIDRFGYSARDVFGTVFCYPGITESHEMAFNIGYADLSAAVLALSKQEGSSNLISNRILALSPVDRGPLLTVSWEVDFKSSWVAKSVLRKLNEAEIEEIRQQIRFLRNIPEAGGLVGWMLEPLAHRYITSSTNDLVLFNMSSDGVDPPHFTLSQDPPNQRLTKGKRTVVRLQAVANLSNCLEHKSYYIPDDPNFPLFDAFTIDLDYANKSATLWILQMTTSRKHGGSAKGYRKIREIIAILKNHLQEGRPQKKHKKSKTAAEQAAPLVQVRYILIVPKDEPQSRNLQWNLPKGWSQNYSRNDHRGKVYCLEVPLNI
ncbi:hypothetical protein M378DRAFT_169206 [Amanita muscaria Koide BX008]|uniref:Uncharacterized protein n=1 Tax=Amanita muscaria (strain Koide BX008) TaxID=946122 RepID=A0A0C2WDW9_AMAMK|nr:hypothetical protein M378DRAFT_169206 [Amanita muscaria Koide BX008]